MVKNVLIVGDLGAGTNIIRNLLLLGNYSWPLQTEKFEKILLQYPDNIELKDWLQQEYILRFWSKHYGVDLSDTLDYDRYCNQFVKLALPVIFINHSAFYQQQEFDEFVKEFDVLFVAPTTELGLEWQIRSYCEKKTVELLHDFSFDNDRESQIQQFKKSNGEEAYYNLNIANMKEIISQRQTDFGKQLPLSDQISLESLLYDSPDAIVNTLNVKFHQNLPMDKVSLLLSKWRNLHWPIEQTTNWKYHHLFL